MFVEFPARCVNRLARFATGRRGAHDLFDANVGGMTVICHHATTHVTLGDNTDELEVFCILNHGRAAAP